MLEELLLCVAVLAQLFVAGLLIIAVELFRYHYCVE